ncbi:MAG: hypothetical protein K2N87_06780 [Eubacterium sp.]|nr:hypothetical protein [Eubacterium sp.]
MRSRKFICIVCAALFLSGCGTMQTAADGTSARKTATDGTSADKTTAGATDTGNIKTDGWRIQDGCQSITEKMAEEIYQKIYKMQQETYEGIQQIENARLVFLEEEKKEGMVTVRAAFEADWTGIRKPEDYPMIQGMYEAKAELSTEKEKKAADEYINGWLMELEPQYQKTERISWQVAVQFQETDKDGYRLLYPFVQESKETLMPLEQYIQEYCKENAKESRRMGKERLLEMVQED